MANDGTPARPARTGSRMSGKDLLRFYILHSDTRSEAALKLIMEFNFYKVDWGDEGGTARTL